MKHNILWFFASCILLAALLLLGGCARGPRPSHRSKASVREMSVTAYCSCKKCCNWKRNWLFKPVVASGPSKGQPKKVGITASGRKAKKGTIAADTGHYPFGTVMYIPGYGYGRVEDRGSAMKGANKIDIYFPSHKKALEWGRRRANVKVWLP